jgi:hypothetical protein
MDLSLPMQYALNETNAQVFSQHDVLPQTLLDLPSNLEKDEESICVQ